MARESASGTDLTPQQTISLVQLARPVRASTTREILRIVDARLEDPNILGLVSGYLKEALPNEEDTTGILRIVKRALQAVADNERMAGGSHLSTSLLEVAISAARRNEPERWLTVLCAKARAVLGPNDATGLWASRRVPPIPDLRLDARERFVDQLVAAIRDVARVAQDAGTALAARETSLRRLPVLLTGRLLGTDLLAASQLDLRGGVALLQTEVQRSDPMPETLALLRRMRELDAPGLADAMRDALGPTPPAEATAAFAKEQEVPGEWARAYGWADAMPPEVMAPWSAAIARCEERWGKASSNGLILPPPVVMWSAQQSPYELDDLRGLSPVDVARIVALWETDPAEDFGPSRHGLANVFKELVEEDPGRWLSSDSREIVQVLGDPAYLSAFFQGGDYCTFAS